MKRAISLLLTVCISFSILMLITACGKDESHDHTYKTEWAYDDTYHWHSCEGEDCLETSDKAEHIWNEGEITTDATAEFDGTKTFACTVCEKTRTEKIVFTSTVSREEFISIFMSDNYTINSRFQSGDDVTVFSAKSSENAFYQDENGLLDSYYAFKDGSWYEIESNDTGYFGSVSKYFMGNSLGALLFGADNETSLGAVYDILSYNENDKFYYVTGMQIDDDVEYKIYFENGFISKMCISELGDEQAMIISDVGSTVVEIPAWSLETTTVNAEEWEECFNVINYTVYSYNNLDEGAIESLLKVTDAACYEEYYYRDDSFMTVYVIKENDSWKRIAISGDDENSNTETSYIDSLDTSIKYLIMDYSDQYADFGYDVVKKAYISETDDGSQVTVYIRNGRIYEINIYNKETKNRFEYVFKNYGTTNIDVPEFIIEG